MRVFVAVLMMVGCLIGAGAALADSHERVLEMWTCKLEEGKSTDDVQAANGKWVKYVNEQIEEGEVRSYVVTTVVGDTGSFMYADSFPSMEAWVAIKAAMEAEAGQAIEQELNEVANCSSNTLHMSARTHAAE